MVCPGFYFEQVQVTKTLTLLGAQHGIDARTRTFVPANESIIGHPCGPVQIMADKVVLDGFTVQGSTLSDPCFIAGIWTNPGSSGTQGGHQILNDIVQNNISGIELDSSCTNPTLVQFNLIQNNNNPGPGSGNAIQTNFGLCNATIDRNKFSGHTSSSVLVVASSTNLTITTNELVGGTPEGIALLNTTASSITGNISIGSTSSATIDLFGGDSGISINGNTLLNGTRGIQVENPFASFGVSPNSGIVANQNCIQGNSIAGLEVDPGGYSGVLNAVNNWWGSRRGPTHPTNPGGNGDKIIDQNNVTFKPWLTKAPCALPPPKCERGDGDGDFQDKDGHTHHGHFHHDDCENGGGDVEDDDRDSGKHFQSTSTNSATFTSSEDSQTLTMIGTGLDNGLPVGFTMIAVDYGGLIPAVYTLTLTNGRTFTGTLVSGSLVIQ